MKEYNKLLLAACMAASKVIIMPRAGTITTVKDITKENFGKLIRRHLLGQIRLGVSPEILGQEDNVTFGCIDIDCPNVLHSEKYKIALSLQGALLKDYGLKAIIETSKSKGFHVWVFFSSSQERTFIQKILQNVINSITEYKIANGQIEVFPKGEKGNAIFLPFFGMFKNENTLNESYFSRKKTTFVRDENTKVIKNPLEAIHQAMRQNDSILTVLKELSVYPECIRKALFHWIKGNRHYLTMAVAAVLKKISKVSEDEAINVVKLIAQFNHDEEINDRINAVKSTYKSDEIAGCSIFQGINENIAIGDTLCIKNCELVAKVYTVKDRVRSLQMIHKGQILKDTVVQLVIKTIEETGKIYASNHKYYLFIDDEKEMIPILKDSISLMNLMTKWGINAAETLYKYVYHELIAYAAENAISVDIHRFAYYDSKNFALYLYNTAKSIFKITEDSITTIENGDEGILFEEMSNYQPFKIVEFKKDTNFLLDIIIKDLNLDNSNPNINQRKIVEIWFYCLFFESIMPTKPLLVSIGEKGSGKSSILRRIGKLLMGKKFNVTSTTPDYKNLITLITNNYLIVLDNMDSPTTQINDSLARIATGQVIMVRDYYTTNTQIEYEAKCYVALTSRKPQFTRDDVADRLVCIFLGRLENNFIAEKDLDKEIMESRDEVMSYVISRLQIIIKNLKKNDDKTFKHVFRIADFADFALKSVDSEVEQNALKNLFSALAQQQKEFATQDDIIYTILKEFVSDKSNENKKFLAPELYKEFKHKAEFLELDKFFNSIYSNPKALTTHLMNIQSNISKEIIIHRQKGHGNNNFYSFIRVDDAKPLSPNEAVEMLMNRSVEEQINAYKKFMLDKGGIDE
ncbi:MAG: TOTE conflict system archaeo-eukaryotic primase domain-containing protein [Opitutales bacterium]